MVDDKRAPCRSRPGPRRAGRGSIPVLLLSLGLACAACAKAPALGPLSARDVAEGGTLLLDAPRATLIEACALALRKQGYTIDVADPDTGLVVTLRSPSPLSGAAGERLFRAYVLEVRELPSGRVEVVAWPAVSESDLRRGNRPFTAIGWDLEEERASWRRLFEDVRRIVGMASP